MHSDEKDMAVIVIVALGPNNRSRSRAGLVLPASNVLDYCLSSASPSCRASPPGVFRWLEEDGGIKASKFKLLLADR